MTAEIRSADGMARYLPAILIFSLLLPFSIYLGPLRLSPHRVVLIIALFPVLSMWMSGKAGPVRGFDFMIIFAFFWAVLSTLIHYGAAAIEGGGMLLVESLGSYFLARACIRTVEDFQRLCKILFAAILVLFPFALLETITGDPILLQIIGKVLPSYNPINQDKRLGMERAQVIFEHSILYGAFVSSAWAPVHYVLNSGRGVVIGGWNYAIVGLSTLFSVSSGALVSLFFQACLTAWDKFTWFLPKRWTLLLVGFITLYVAVDLASHANPAELFIGYLAFSKLSGYTRIGIFNEGIANIKSSPIFGVDLRSWTDSYFASSVDNYWLLEAMRYGLPMFFAFVIALIWIIRECSRNELPTEDERNGRAAYLTSLGGLFLAGCTVHYWNEMFVWFMFLIGSGVWATRPSFLATAKDVTDQIPEDAPPDFFARQGAARGPTRIKNGPGKRRESLPFSRPVVPADNPRGHKR